MTPVVVLVSIGASIDFLKCNLGLPHATLRFAFEKLPPEAF
ncbi:hypothetical protein [Arthrobacter sp. YN]|nr:hypothetical protein [Arthrobacter sp. YN]